MDNFWQLQDFVKESPDHNSAVLYPTSQTGGTDSVIPTFYAKVNSTALFLFSNLLYHHQLKSRFLQPLKYPFNEKSNR